MFFHLGLLCGRYSLERSLTQTCIAEQLLVFYLFNPTEVAFYISVSEEHFFYIVAIEKPPSKIQLKENF